MIPDYDAIKISAIKTTILDLPTDINKFAEPFTEAITALSKKDEFPIDPKIIIFKSLADILNDVMSMHDETIEHITENKISAYVVKKKSIALLEQIIEYYKETTK